MRKLLFIALVIILGLFSGCGTPRVASMELYVGADPALVSHMFYKDTLNIVPDYSKRDLTVKYDVVYPDRTEETEGQDVSTEGLLGGDFFDTFNTIVKKFEKPSDFYSLDEVEGGSEFVLKIKMLDGGVKEYDLRLSKDEKDFDLVNDFYSDVTSLFTQDVY